MGKITEIDGGRAGWILVLTWWLTAVIWITIGKGLGIMLPTLQQQLDADTWIMGWTVSMSIAASGLSCKSCFCGASGEV